MAALNLSMTYQGSNAIINWSGGVPTGWDGWYSVVVFNMDDNKVVASQGDIDDNKFIIPGYLSSTHYKAYVFGSMDQTVHNPDALYCTTVTDDVVGTTVPACYYHASIDFGRTTPLVIPPLIPITTPGTWPWGILFIVLLILILLLLLWVSFKMK